MNIETDDVCGVVVYGCAIQAELRTLEDLDNVGPRGSRFTKGRGGNNCPEYPSRTKQDAQLRSGTATTDWRGSVCHPVRVIQVERLSFRAAHYDLLDDRDALLILTRGRKLWILAYPSRVGGLLERLCGGNDSQRGFTDAVKVLRGLSAKEKSNIFFAVLSDSKTLYLPYAWVHSVVTLCEEDEGGSFVCSMWYLELSTSSDRVEAMKRRAQQKSRCGKRRMEALQE